MNILATQFTLKTNSLEIYLSGCNGKPKCKNCHNPEGWNFKAGKEYNSEYYQEIKNKVNNFDNIIKNIMIMGGEPLDQEKDEFNSFLSDMKKLNKIMWLFTRYDIEETPDNINEFFDYVKCGRYLEELTTDSHTQYGIKLATSNQKIYKRGLDY